MSDIKYYTTERNAQIVLSLLKAKNIKRIVASPGTTNISIVGSIMNDPFFEIYSAPDERSAAYIACGMAAESGEPVIISCTGATASRNYYPALTEAYYRKLPILALTSSLQIGRSGHLYPQFIDRTILPKDTARYSTQIFPVNSPEDEWNCIIKANEALLELRRNGGGPVHINLMTVGEFANFSVKELPSIRNINRYLNGEDLPKLPSGSIAIFVGSHKPFTQYLQDLIDQFCAQYDAVVFCDHTSGYKGKYRVLYPIVATQQISDLNIDKLDLLIHLGEVSGDYYTQGRLRSSKAVWRVNEDGEIRDYFRKLENVFQMKEHEFFSYYVDAGDHTFTKHLNSCLSFQKQALEKLPELPFSNIWIASVSHNLLPSGSKLHLGILNSLRAWNYFELQANVKSYCNVGGFGIDGILSTLIGSSLIRPDQLYFCVLGDLAFFYDLNSLGNRHVGRNLRILLVNNGKGTEFRNYTHPGSSFGDRADDYIAAGGHYGNKSSNLVKHYTEDLGLKYMSASSKEEYLACTKDFFNPNINISIVLEVFTTDEDESNALLLLNNTLKDSTSNIKNIIKGIAGEKVINIAKKIIRKQ